MNNLVNTDIKWLPILNANWKICRFKDIYQFKKEIVGDKVSEYERLALTLKGVVKRSKDDEYNKRLEEIKRFIKQIDTKYEISIIEGRYLPEEYFTIAKGLEEEKERGKRCYLCYKLRLEETARVAKSEGFDFFTTTLSLSPHKNYKRSIELSRKYNLYRQDYCGCIYSKR